MDDSAIAATVNNTSPDYQPSQVTFNNLLAWTKANHVTLNHKKTVVMHFAFALTTGDHTLDVVRAAKIPGVTLDDRLTWEQHVSTIVTSASLRLYMLRRLKTLGCPHRNSLPSTRPSFCRS
ncbi:uncharacterized protein [Penaeus vannamei]|uniref:uncharacterized protein n=1 Tax=Penaeus vannamei TaxID=6689 RepID=UPI00387F76CB